MAAKKKSSSKKHPGFENVARKIARRQGVSMDRARAILAAGTRKAARTKSGKVKPAAKKNPRLLRVKGRPKR